ncbi:MAG: BamA/TamA family outer membrane protein [Muribaculaceae bacterium]|nr:BamA/TamA family outer membrane protein [Muribaculaceae bacterium]
MNKTIKYACGLLALLITGACSTTRRIPEGELLYTGVKKINIARDADSARIATGITEAIDEAVDVAPNNYLSIIKWRYPFPLGLWVYNNWPNPEKGFRHWLYEKLVEEPVLVSDVRPEVRTRMITEILDNNGYFSGTATYELVHPRNKKKAAIVYNINPGRPYPIDSIRLLPDTTALNRKIDSLARLDSYLTSPGRYSADSLNAARTRITNRLRNMGYYFFRPDYIEYLADSIAEPGHIQMQMVMASNTPRFSQQPYRVGNVYMTVNRSQGGGTPDTTQLRNTQLIQMMPSRLRHQLIPECITFRKGRLFSVRNMDRTQAYLSRLGIFSGINIEAFPDTTAVQPTLDVYINATLDVPLEASIEANASYKSNSYLGPGLTLGVSNKNLFGGGEQLNVSLTGSYEWQTGSGGGRNRSIFNSYEVGLTASLAFPRLLAPKFIPRRRAQLNWTRFTINADLLNRPHYFKMAQFNLSASYDWRLNRYATSTYTPFKLTYTNLMHTTADFDSIMAANPAVALSFQSQFIPQMLYTYNYSRLYGRDNTLDWTFTVQEAGNLFWCIYEACGKKGEKKLFNTPFSQFVKGSTQLVYGRRLGGDNWLVSRVAVGAAHAYANSSVVPYAEQFYVGGANSIRAFTVRSLGPGSYRAPAGKDDDYFDQTGTFKFEANVEFRFPIYGPLHGAVFVDTGNVWLLKEDPQRPGGLLRGSTFFKDLALGTGAGLRFDIGMLVLRGDLGIGIHAPYETSRHGYYNMESFKKSLAFHLAIGYPF